MSLRRPLSLVLVSVLGLSMALAACSDDGEGGTATTLVAPSGDRQAVVTQLVDGVIGPLVEAAASSAADVEEATAAYCASPSEEAQQAALDAVDAGLYAYEQLDPVDMGPIMLRRTEGHVDYPVDADRVEEVLSGDPDTDGEAIADRTPSSVRGLTTARYLLVTSPAPADEPVRCEFLVAIATDASTALRAVVVDSLEGAGGEPAYYDRLTGDATDSEPPKETIDVIVNMVLSVLDTDAGLMADPGDLDPTVVRRAASAHMATIGLVWGDGTGGLGALVDPELAARVVAEIDAAQEALDGDGDAEEAVEEVRASMGTEVVSALDVVVGFSENDGDS